MPGFASQNPVRCLRPSRRRHYIRLAAESSLAWVAHPVSCRVEASVEEGPSVQREPAHDRRVWERKLAYCEDMALFAVLGAALAIPGLSCAAFVLAIATYVRLAFSALAKN
jgi:hypothetical protein